MGKCPSCGKQSEDDVFVVYYVSPGIKCVYRLLPDSTREGPKVTEYGRRSDSYRKGYYAACCDGYVGDNLNMIQYEYLYGGKRDE